jgi:catechol 2,3-dioxygenase-like lactoylglutathione lyase family enzyme
MVKTSKAKVKVKEIGQIAFVVKDAQKTAENYWNILGIGPWEIYAWESPLVYDRTYHGKSATAREKIAIAQVGNVELDLCQHVDGKSVYQDFLIDHGEGIHHLFFSVKNADQTAEILANEGFPSLQSVRFGPKECSAAVYYVDVKPLHCTWAPVHKEFIGIIGAEPTRYPATWQESTAKVRVKAIAQIGIVVKNLEEVMKNYWNILGIGPWEVCEMAPPTLHDRVYHSRPSKFTMRVALSSVGPVQLGLVQPLSGDNIYSDFIEEHGEGLHYLQFIVDDIKGTTKAMNSDGFTTLMSGGFSDGHFSCFDTVDVLKCIWEAFQIPKIMPPAS